MVIGIVIQLKNLNYYKLLHLLNVTKMYCTLQNIITRYKSYIGLHKKGSVLQFKKKYFMTNLIFYDKSFMKYLL